MADTAKRIILPHALGCFTWLAKPRPPMKNSNREPTYQLVLIWKKSDKDKLAALAAAIKEAATAEFGANPKGKIRMPLRDGDVEKAEYPEFKGSYFVTVASKRRPPVVNRKGEPILDPGEDAYSGCTFRASVHVFAYPAGEGYSQGVSIGLDALQVVEKGPRLDGGGSMSEEDAAAEFKEFESAGGADGSVDDIV